MRSDLKSSLARGLGACVATAGLAAFAAPAFAQVVYEPADPAYAPATVGEVTVYGRRGADGRPNTLSRVISISDLDLRSDRDVREMRERVRHAARQLCEELGETGGAGVTPSCQDDAVRSAERQSRFAIAQARSNVEYAYVAPVYPPPYAGEYAPPASAVIPVPYDDDPPL